MISLRSIFSGKPRFPKESRHVIIPAFKIDGVQYFQFQDPFNAAYMRGLGAIKFYDDFSRRCSREYLQLHVEAVRQILTNPNKGVINLMELHKLNEQMAERMNWIVEVDYLYNFASVVFFDATESPYDYDMGYCKKKIELWKKQKDTKDFFLQTPLVQLIPFLKECNFSFPEFLENVDKLTALHLESLFAKLPWSERKNSLLKSFGLPEETPRKSQS